MSKILAVGMIRFDNGLTINLEVSWALHNQNTQNAGPSLRHRRRFSTGAINPALFRDVNENSY